MVPYTHVLFSNMRKINKLSSKIGGFILRGNSSTKCQHHYYFFLGYVLYPSQNHFHNHLFIFFLIQEEILRRAHDNSKIKYAHYRDYSKSLTISTLIAGSQCTIMDKQVTSTPSPLVPGNGGGGGVWLPVFILLTTCRLRTSN